MPIAAWIVRSTEQLAHYTGDAVGGLLNATFGNAPELIIAIVALRAGLLDMVLASLVGAILANLLLALGLSFFLGGLKHRDQSYRADATHVYVSMMLLAVTSMAVPSAFRQLSGEAVAGARHLNLAVAVVLLALYVLYLLFMLKTHPHLFASEGGGGGHEEAGAERWSVGRAVATLLAASALAAWMSEVMVGAAEGSAAVGAGNRERHSLLRNDGSAERAVDERLLLVAGAPQHLVAHPAEGESDIEARRGDELQQRGRERAVRAVAVGGTSIDIMYKRVNGASGGFQDSLRAFDRENRPCRRCGTPIQKTVVGQRGTHFCPTCQELL